MEEEIKKCPYLFCPDLNKLFTPEETYRYYLEHYDEHNCDTFDEYLECEVWSPWSEFILADADGNYNKESFMF